MKDRSKKGEIDQKKGGGWWGVRGGEREVQIEIKKKERASEREPQCEYGMNVNGLLKALDENKNQM